MIQVTKQRDLKTLVFDFETKPGAYWYDDTTTTLVCAWAAKFVGDDHSVVSAFMAPDWLVPWLHSTAGYRCTSRRLGMQQFQCLWSCADQVVTHNGKRFDVPIINGALDRLGLPALSPKTHIDTLCDRRSSRGVPRSLEKLAERYELECSKLNVSQETWERAYEFEPQAISTVIERAESDVVLTEQLYLESIKRGILQ